MQQHLDLSHASLGAALATLDDNARRQRRFYGATIVLLLVMVAASVVLFITVAASKQLDYSRTLARQFGADFSLRLDREAWFLRRANPTLAFYHDATSPNELPPGAEQAIRERGALVGDVPQARGQFTVLVGRRAFDGWGDQSRLRLWRLFEAAQSMLATYEAFQLGNQCVVVGLDDDYALLFPNGANGVNDANGAGNAQRTPAVIATLRATLQREIRAQTGAPVPADGRPVRIGPYVDPLSGVPVVAEVSGHYERGQPASLIAAILPVPALTAMIRQQRTRGALMLLRPNGRVLVAAPPSGPAATEKLRTLAMAAPDNVYRYSWDGAMFVVRLGPGGDRLASLVSWRDLAVSLGWQLFAIVAMAVLLMTAIVGTARVWGLRLLRATHEQATRALESEALNRTLVDATPVGLCIVRERDYRIVVANALAHGMLGLTANDDRVPPHLITVFAQHESATDDAAAASRTTHSIVPADPPSASGSADDAATRRYLQFDYTPARYAGENVLFCAVQDVTARRALEHALRIAQQTTEATMRARSNFFAAMSHEIRTPLNALLGNLELFARTPGLEAHAPRLAALNVASNALRGIVNDILDFSKIDAGEMKLVSEPFVPLAELEALAASYAPLCAARGLRLYASLSPSLGRSASGDRLRIAQIVNNLMGNALKFTPHGKITLSASLDEPDADADRSANADARCALRCRIADSGIGMDRALVARIFKPFVQGDTDASSRHGGTGLGLSICARLCELMGGRIEVESVVGVGSAFSVILPLAPCATAQAEANDTDNANGTVDGAVRHPSRGLLGVVCVDARSGQGIEAWTAYAGWSTHRLTSLTEASAWLRANAPRAVLVTDDYDAGALDTLRAQRSVPIVWLTWNGPHRPTPRQDGIIEANALDHAALIDAIEYAVDGPIASNASAPLTTQHTDENDFAPLDLDVLVAEDNPLNQALVLEQLATLGCTARLAADGREALALLGEALPDVVLTDIHMPHLDGYQLLARIRERYPALRVFAFSAVTDQGPSDSWREQGFTAYVAKPASLESLSRALRTVQHADEHETVIVPAPDSVAPAASTDSRARYVAILRDHLATDLPRLTAIVEGRDRDALRDWAHSAAGAFVIVQETAFAAQCRELQTLCLTDTTWSEAMEARAFALRDALHERFIAEQPSMPG